MGGVEVGGVGKGGEAASRGAVVVALDDVDEVDPPLVLLAAAAACCSLVRRSSGHLLVLLLVLLLPSAAPSRVGGGVFQQKDPPLTSSAPCGSCWPSASSRPSTSGRARKREMRLRPTLACMPVLSMLGRKVSETERSWKSVSDGHTIVLLPHQPILQHFDPAHHHQVQGQRRHAHDQAPGGRHAQNEVERAEGDSELHALQEHPRASRTEVDDVVGVDREEVDLCTHGARLSCEGGAVAVITGQRALGSRLEGGAGHSPSVRWTAPWRRHRA
eukprot:scaffold20920_cov67-Phaeocystis_antarctica.AAC.14